MKKILDIINIILIIVLIFILVSAIYKKYILKEPIVKVFGYASLKVVSGSMDPVIKVGDKLIIKQKYSYNIGDIVTYIDDRNIVITHRIVDIKDNKYFLKGDFNNLVDKPITKDRIQGKVINK